MKPNERFTIEERAARFQRRYTGPWRTVQREFGPVVVSTRYRRRRRSEWSGFAVAWHDLWMHVIGRTLVLPVLRRLARLIDRGESA